MQLDLNPVWQGDAAAQFMMYANNAATVLNSGQASMVSLTKATAAFGIFPPLGAIDFTELIGDINDAFATFWQDCLNLMNGLLKNMTSLVGAGLDLDVIRTTFPKIPEIGSTAQVVIDPERRRIRPGADHS